MTTHDIARSFCALLAEGRFEDASQTYWAEDVVALEDMPGPMARLQGAAAIAEKSAWWVSNHEVHATRVEGPWVHGDQFTIRFTFEVTPKGGSRTMMDEIALYTVTDGKISEERFFYALPA